ncbi:Acid resistance membrane protein HdeD [Fructobacillus cardui]|uniref:HdeD family acid-resistance protein n=1 Tax=Fructobacillus cardui TaxID=2893170 RepID=UPI002DAF7905|nr:Acid resistance membrane protein HdeD [Fructobacillus cardui]
MDKFINKMRRSLGINGLLTALFGVFIIVWPEKSASFISMIIGFSLLVTGFVRFLASFNRKNEIDMNHIVNVMVSIVYWLAGIFIFADIKYATISLLIVVGILVGIAWVSEGISQLTFLNNISNGRAAFVFLAIINIIAGVVLIISPFIGGLLLWQFLGFMLLFIGVMKLVQYFVIRS